jgi:beta-lactamase class A
LILAFAVINIPSGNTPEQKEQSSVANAQIIKQPDPIDETRLAADINAILARSQGYDIGVSVTDLKTGASYTYGVDKQFIAASVGKLLSATVYLHETEDGKRTLDDDLAGITARAQIQKMVAVSDNSAWVALNSVLGHDALADYAYSHGLNSYDPTQNKIKPSEVAKLLSDIYQGKLLNKDNTKFLLANMQQDQEELQFIRKYVDPSVPVYHKAGWLEDRAHDTAIVELAERPFTLVIFSKSRHGVYDFDKGQKLFSEITTATLERFKS